MMRRLRREAAFAWLIVLFISLPAVLYAYLGLSSRLMGDDFGLFATALRLSGWHNFNYWWHSWYSSYTFILFNDLLAPLGPEYIAQAFPSINIVLWLLGLTWLYAVALRRLQLKRRRGPISVALAAATIAATFTSFQTWESIFWYAANVRYVLPIGIFMIFLAAAITFGDAPRSRRLVVVASVLGAVICFINVGFSELHAAIQVISLSLILLCMFTSFDRPKSRSEIFLLAAGWLGSAAGLLLQLLNPGWSARREKLLQAYQTDPVGSLPQLIADTITTSIDFICNPVGVPSFLLIMVAGMLAVLIVGGRKAPSETAVSVSLSALPILFGLVAQLCFVPALWRNSDAPSPVFGDFFGAAVNALFIGVSIFVLWRRRQIEAWLTARQNGVMIYIFLTLGAALALIALTQLTGLPATFSAYLFVSALLLLGILSWQLHLFEADARSRRFGMAAAAAVAVALAAWALPVAVGHLSLGFVFKRTLVFSTLMQTLSALIWGGYLGFLVGRICSSSPAPSTWIARFSALGILIAVSIILGILWMQTRLIPDFHAFALSWDARHRRIVQLRESGESEIEVAPLRFDLSEFIAADGRTFDSVSPYFYGVDSIVVAENSAP